jgi:L-lactate dehydrogenase complex protein LldF
MSHDLERFLLESRQKAFDPVHRKKMLDAVSVYDRDLKNSIEQFSDLELARKRAANRKHKVINNLDRYLQEFESNFLKRGGKIIWAPSERDVHKEIQSILKKENAQVIVKPKTLTFEELDLKELFRKSKKEVWETDLGEFILQVAGDTSSHMVNPAMHMSGKEIAVLFNEKFGIPAESSPEEMSRFAMEHLRSKFPATDVGITGANFLIADTGAVVLTENEGNSLMSIAFPRIHIVIAGIEKVLPSINDLHLFLPLLSSHATGQQVAGYNHLVFGPRNGAEPDGPEKMIVILVDNRRTDILKFREQRQALYCIRCGACMNECPVFRNIGGHAYETVYPGPIGSVISPIASNFRELNHLSQASTLCGKCTGVCPVRIPLHELLLNNRNEMIRLGYHGPGWKFVMKWWKRIVMKRWYFDRPGPNLKNRVLRRYMKKRWGTHREFPVIAEKSFKELWQETHPEN